jgi:putative inorganic carbon (HCO3(-)) transporter
MGNRNHGRRSALLFDWSLFFYFTITSLSLLVAQDVTLSIFEVCLLAEACLVYFYVANAVRTRQDVLFIVKFLMIGCLLESLIIIFMRIAVTPSTNWDFPIHIIAEFVGRSGLMRVGGTIGVPNIAGAYLSILLALAISLQFTNIGHTYKQLAAAVIGLGTVAIIFTFSRGGWIALVLAVIVICFTISRHRGFSLKAPIAILAVLALLYVPFHSVISTRLFGNDNGSAEARVPLDRLAFRIIQANPVLGVGVDNFTVVMNRYVTSEFRNGWLFAVHNRYLLILAETGIGGLLAYLAFLLGTLRKAWLCWRKNDPLLSPIALGLAAGITGHMVHMTVDLFRGRPIQQLLWLVAGLITAMHRMCAPAPCADSPSRFK